LRLSSGGNGVYGLDAGNASTLSASARNQHPLSLKYLQSSLVLGRSLKANLFSHKALLPSGPSRIPPKASLQ
jgi:hypothetical protein